MRDDDGRKLDHKTLRGKPGLRHYLRRTRSGLLRIDHAAVRHEQHLDGKWLLCTSDSTLTPDDLGLQAADRGRTRLARH